MTRTYEKPFDHEAEILQFFENQCYCNQNEYDDTKEYTYQELLTMYNELNNAIADWDIIIQIQLNSNDTDVFSLRNDRKNRQKEVFTRNIIKSKLKMMEKNNMKEFIVA